MKNYDVCKDINNFYFTNYASLSLAIPAFFDPLSEEDDAVQAVKQLIEKNELDQAIALADQSMQKFMPHTHHAFTALQVFAMWQQGKVPNADLIEYFTTIEEIMPDDAAINFDKAALLVREKRFNDAMKELQKALSKNPGYGLAIVLQFWIFYFSRDDQWRNSYKLVLKNKLLSETITNLVEIVEAINDKKPTDLYIFADVANLREANNNLFAKFPEFVMVKPPVTENVLFVAAETNYLREYISTLMLSKLELKSADFGIHVHLYNPLGVDLEFLQMYDETYPQLKLSYSYERTSLTLNTERPAYYASMRFARAYQLLEKSDSIKKLGIVDADAILRQNPFDHEGIEKSDVTLSKALDTSPLWEKFIAGFACFSKTDFAEQAFGYMTNALLKNFVAGKEFWFIDQVVLFDMHKYNPSPDKIYGMKVADIFGHELGHTDKSLFWTYTNENKVMNNPMNAERARLMKELGLSQDWNLLARGKYGNIAANKNDAYVGPSLLSAGSWCDHEIKIMRNFLELGDTVLEVGANMGSHTLPLAKIVGNTGRVYAIEPQRLMFQTICANIAMNSMQNVYVYNIGCGEEDGEFMLTELDPTVKQNFGGYRPKSAQGEIKVPIKTIDSLDLPACTMIKMDIEGMELEAFKGARETLKKFQPVLFFESHGDEVYPIAEFLGGLGYTLYDFAIPNDPMFLAVTEKDKTKAEAFKIGILQSK